MMAFNQPMKEEQALVTSATKKEAMFLLTEDFRDVKLSCGVLFTFLHSSDHN